MKKLIDDTLSTYEMVVDGDCRSVREFLASGKTEARARKVDLAAAQRFLDERCQGR